MIAAIYARKSTEHSDRSDETRSTVRQVARATEYATANGWSSGGPATPVTGAVASRDLSRE